MNTCTSCGTSVKVSQQFCPSCGNSMVINPKSTRITKSSSNVMIAGVCGGLAEHYNMDPSMVRLLFVLFTLMGGSGVILYLVLVLVLPDVHKD